MNERPPFVVRAADVLEEESAYPAPFDVERLSFSRDLGRAAGSRTLGASHERLPPGRRTSFTHAHLREEELVYVLAGRPTLRWIPSNGTPRETELAPGDFVTFPAGTGTAHTFWNRTDEEAELFVVGERKTSECVTYPDDPDYVAWRHERRPLGTWVDAHKPEGAARWPAMRIETARTVLRPWEPMDTRTLIATQVRNRDHLLPWMTWANDVPTTDEMLARIVEFQRQSWVGRDMVYGVFGREGQVVGGTGLHDRIGEFGREIGYWTDQAHEGKGYVTEWCAALLRVGFDVLALDRIEIHCDPENERSAAVPRRLGFTHEATLPRRTAGVDGQPRDTMIWTLYADTFHTSELAKSEVWAWDGAGRRLL